MASEADETEDVPLPLGLVPPPAIFAQPPAVGEGAGSPAAAAAFSAASLCALVRSASSFWISRMDRCPAENTQPLTKLQSSSGIDLHHKSVWKAYHALGRRFKAQGALKPA